MPTEPAEVTLRKLLGDRPDDVVEIALAAREAVMKAGKGASELLYVTYCISDAFTFTGKLGQGFIHIATYAKHVNLGFNRGAELEDPDESLEGTGKLIRHVRLNSLADLRKRNVKKLIKAAVDQGLSLAEAKGGVQPPIFVIKDSRK